MEGVKDSKKIEVLNVKKLKNVNVSRQSIYNFIKRNCMEKVGPGIYISKDVLEDEVDEKFYLSEERVGQLTWK